MTQNLASISVMEMAPLVSVIVPCYNLAQYLGQAIESLQAQTYNNLEILVIDDGSTDNFYEVVSRYLADEQVRLVSQSNQGAATARNNGIRQSQGRYLQFLDQDDWLHPEKIGREVAILEQETSVGLVYCDFYLYFQVDGHLAEMPGQLFSAEGYSDFEKLWLGSSFPPHAPLVRREIVEKAGGFYTGTFCSDYDFWLRLAALDCTMRYLPEALIFYRRHAQAMTSTISQEKIKAEVTRVKARIAQNYPKKAAGVEKRSLEILCNSLALRQQNLSKVEAELVAVKAELVNLNNYYLAQVQLYQQHESDMARRAETLKRYLKEAGETAKALESEIKKLQDTSLGNIKRAGAASEAAG